MISKRNILHLKVRQDIYNFIEKNPGMNIREISCKLKIPYSTLNHHLNHLKRLDLIRIKKEEKNKYIYATMKIGKQEKQIIRLLREKIFCEIFLYLLWSFAFTQSEVSKELELKPSHVSYYLKKMLKVGLIEEVRVENGIIYPFPNNQDINIKYKPVTSEKFYRRKNTDILHKTYRVLITHKNSLFDEILINSYIDILKHGNSLRNDLNRVDDQINSAYDFFSYFFRPPFAY